MPATATFLAAVDHWLADLEAANQSTNTVLSQHYALRIFVQWVELQPQAIDISDLTLPLLNRYVHALQDRQPPLAASTLFAYIGVLVRWLSFLLNDGYLGAILNHRGQPVMPDRVRQVLDRLVGKRQPLTAPRMPDLRRLPAYYHAILNSFVAQYGVPSAQQPPALQRSYLNLLRNRALIMTLFCTGGRINEVLSLHTSEIWNGHTVRYAMPIRGKGKRVRELRFDALAQEWITAYLHARATLLPGTHLALFISHGPKAKGARLSDVTAWRVVKEAAEALADQLMREGRSEAAVAPLRAVSPHSLRHYFAQSMLEEGASYDDIALVLGHSSTKVTQQVYAQLSPERALEIADTYAPRATLRFDQSPPATPIAPSSEPDA